MLFSLRQVKPNATSTAIQKTGVRIQADLSLLGELILATGIPAETVGARIMRLRKDKSLTQQGLAERLGVSQPVVSDYEHDVIGLDSERIVQLAQILGVSADEILGLEKPSRMTAASIKNQRLYRQLQSIDKLPKRDQDALLRTIDAFMSKAG